MQDLVPHKIGFTESKKFITSGIQYVQIILKHVDIRFKWAWNTVWYSEGGKEVEGVQEQGADEDMWA